MRFRSALRGYGVAIVAAASVSCSSLLSLGDYTNLCRGPVDAPDTCQGGGGGKGGGEGGSGGGPAPECHVSSDCKTASACLTATCSESHLCVTNNTMQGTPCSDGGKVCDGSGHCVACNKVDDCPDPGTTCVTSACTAHACVNRDAAAATACTDHQGNTCDASGHCFGAAQITGGGAHACALTTLGDVECWGDDDHGQLGDGQTTNSSTPVKATALTSAATAVSAGLYYTCAITTAGAIVCWGTSMEGETGMGLPTSGVTAISAGERHACAVGTTVGLVCWGDNSHGQLGCGSNCVGVTQSATPESPDTTFGFKGVSAGGASTCAITDGGTVMCWGDNSAGQLGDGTTTSRPKPVAISGLTGLNIVALAQGNLHGCALTSTGAVYCWGDNTYGQLGNGTGTSSLTPVPVTGLGSGVKSIPSGEIQSCATLADGSAACWGDNQLGDLGDGTNSQRKAPVPVSGLSAGVAGVSCGYNFTCAVMTTGAAKCWGDDALGELGDGMMTEQLMPVDVLGL